MAIGRTNCGAGGGLNFQVVGGTTQPTSPKENTIWVNTSTGIAGWVMQSEAPTASEGLVWINTASKSDAAFYADRKHTVTLYPVGAKQFIGSAWTNLESYIFQNGTWQMIALAEFYLMRQGVLADGYTGMSGSADDGYFSQWSSANSDQKYNVSPALSIKNFTQLQVTISIPVHSETTKVICGLAQSTTPAATGYAASVTLSVEDAAKNTHNIDISSLDPSLDYYYCMLSHGGSAGGTATNTYDIKFV